MSCTPSSHRNLTTAPTLTGEIPYITNFAHFPLSRSAPGHPTLCRASPTLPHSRTFPHSLPAPHAVSRTLCMHHCTFCALTPHNSALSNISMLQTTFPHTGPHSCTLPSVPLASPGHIILSLLIFPPSPSFLDHLATLLVYKTCNYTLDTLDRSNPRDLVSLSPSCFCFLRAPCSLLLVFLTVLHMCTALAT